MRTGLDNRPSATTYEVEKLVQLAWRGQVRVPHFQRGFRWGREDVIKLFDSIIRGYPVGSLLLWARRAEEQRLTLGALAIDAPRMEEALWVVDGQQRVTSLANALHREMSADPRFALAYDLKEEKFLPRSPGDASHIIPLPILFDLPRLLTWFTKNPKAAEFQNQAFELTTVIRQHPVPAYLVDQEEPEVLRDIFDRMNSHGKRLSRAEIFTALHAGDASEQTPALTFGVIAEQVDRRLSFGRIDDNTVHAAVLARRGSDIQREIRIEFSRNDRRGAIEFPGEDRDTAFREGEEALVRAVAFLQKEVGVAHITMLPYRYLLVVLARFFGHFRSPGPSTLRALRRWFWRAAVLGPSVFRGSTTGAIRQLCAKVHPNDLERSVTDLLEAVNGHTYALPDATRFKTNEASAKIILCSWWALRPRDPSTGEAFEIGQLAEALAEQSTVADAVRYVYPASLVPGSHRMWAANRMIVPYMEYEAGKAVGEALWSPVLMMSERDWLRTLESHAMTPGIAALAQGGAAVEFLRQRQELVTAQLCSFLERMCEWDFGAKTVSDPRPGTPETDLFGHFTEG